MSLREKILAADDLPREIVEVPEWGVRIELRGLNGRQRAAIMQKYAEARGRIDIIGDLYPEMVIASARDPETGRPIFEPADRDALATKSGDVLERLATIVSRLSGLQPGQVEEMAKN